MRRGRRIRGGDADEDTVAGLGGLYNWAGGDEWTGFMSRKEGLTLCSHNASLLVSVCRTRRTRTGFSLCSGLFCWQKVLMVYSHGHCLLGAAYR